MGSAEQLGERSWRTERSLLASQSWPVTLDTLSQHLPGSCPLVPVPCGHLGSSRASRLCFGGTQSAGLSADRHSAARDCVLSWQPLAPGSALYGFALEFHHVAAGFFWDLPGREEVWNVGKPHSHLGAGAWAGRAGQLPEPSEGGGSPAAWGSCQAGIPPCWGPGVPEDSRFPIITMWRKQATASLALLFLLFCVEGTLHFSLRIFVSPLFHHYSG